MTLSKTEDNKVRISPRISRAIYLLAKDVYRQMGVTLEDRVEFLLKRDLKKEMNKPWFKDQMTALGKEFDLDLPEGMTWEDVWLKWLLSDNPASFVRKTDEGEA